MKRLIMALGMLAILTVAAGEYEIAWQQEGTASRLVSIELSGENLARLGGHPEWLRLYDRNGTVVPWARRQRTVDLYGERRVNVPLVMDEVRAQVPRMEMHPSLALWCGNNEAEAMFGFLPKSHKLIKS